MSSSIHYESNQAYCGEQLQGLHSQEPASFIRIGLWMSETDIVRTYDRTIIDITEMYS